jgi:replicative superfamily II helicase
MISQQVMGRAGRRGLDKEGNVIFVGYSWERIKELSISESPVVVGQFKLNYSLEHANRLSELASTNQTWTSSNFLNKTILKMPLPTGAMFSLMPRALVKPLT